MKELLEEVRKALENKMYISALTLGLTLPDIFGNIEYPQLNGSGNCKKRYVKWYDEHITEYNRSSETEDRSSRMTNGNLAYQIRCSVLHSFDISEAEKENTEIYFDLFKSKTFGNLITEIEIYLKKRFPDCFFKYELDAIFSSKNLDNKLKGKINTGISAYFEVNITRYKILDPDIDVCYTDELCIDLTEELGHDAKMMFGFNSKDDYCFGLSWNNNLKIVSLNVPQLVYPILWCAEKYYESNKDKAGIKFPTLFSE